jgi:hypothetical protein
MAHQTGEDEACAAGASRGSTSLSRREGETGGWGGGGGSRGGSRARAAQTEGEAGGGGGGGGCCPRCSRCSAKAEGGVRAAHPPTARPPWQVPT